MHDRPPAHFHRALPAEAQGALGRLSKEITPPVPPSFDLQSLGVASSSKPNVSTPRPAFLISSTSWTADEDFAPLLTALDTYQTALSSGQSLPKLFVLITGKGALRAAFERQVAALRERTRRLEGRLCQVCFLVRQRLPYDTRVCGIWE